jgi:ergothioneine biosynthesis protein EgtB
MNTASGFALEAASADEMARRYESVRAQTQALATPLSEADCQAQSMPDASPIKWHLAHTTWFLETFVLEAHEPEFAAFNPAFRVLFNSYYQAVGAQHPRPQRGLITRPDLAQVLAYRAVVDERVQALWRSHPSSELARLLALGLQHEQQHQELMLTDLKHLLSCNPLQPVYRAGWPLVNVAPRAMGWHGLEGDVVEIGHAGAGFAFDNETPRHRHYLRPYALADRLVTHGEYAAFVDEGGYEDPRWWLSAGWEWVRQLPARAPLYWQRQGNGWHTFTLHGLVPIDAHTPMVHLSYFEAEAFARWYGAQIGEPTRLATEAEWEHAASPLLEAGRLTANFVESGLLHPAPLADANARPAQLFGDVWEWTQSAYLPYPGFRPWEGAVGEYNGKFMINQMVLRGGSCATPRDHIRASYRNFFPTEARWQFSGLRLAKDIDQA